MSRDWVKIDPGSRQSLFKVTFLPKLKQQNTKLSDRIMKWRWYQMTSYQNKYFPIYLQRKKCTNLPMPKSTCFKRRKKERNQNLNENTIKTRMYMYGIVPCSSFRNILKVFESVMRMRIFFLSGEPSTIFTHLQQRQIVIANIMSHNAQSTLTSYITQTTFICTRTIYQCLNHAIAKQPATDC